MMILRAVLKAILFPPLLQILGVLLAFLLWSRRRVLASVLLAVSLGSWYALTLPVTASGLAGRIETYPALPSPSPVKDTQALVVLGGGAHRNAPEFSGEDDASTATLVRLRYGALLHRETGVPLLVSGGRVYDIGDAEADIMQRVLQRDFRVKATWVESASRTTHENAEQSAAMLIPQGITRITLVTHASHMVRAVEEFERVGFQVLPAPTGFKSTSDTLPVVIRWLPHPSAWEYCQSAFNELAGRLWYRLSAPAHEQPT